MLGLSPGPVSPPSRQQQTGSGGLKINGVFAQSLLNQHRGGDGDAAASCRSETPETSSAARPRGTERERGGSPACTHPPPVRAQTPGAVVIFPLFDLFWEPGALSLPRVPAEPLSARPAPPTGASRWRWLFTRVSAGVTFQRASPAASQEKLEEKGKRRAGALRGPAVRRSDSGRFLSCRFHGAQGWIRGSASPGLCRGFGVSQNYFCVLEQLFACFTQKSKLKGLSAAVPQSAGARRALPVSDFGVFRWCGMD